jgi:deoxyuridine 5'-triphosphate nucleotidohydrolase
LKRSNKTLFSYSEFNSFFLDMQNIIFCSYNENLLPYKATEWSIWRDLKLAEDITVPQGEVVLAPTWIKSALPLWWWIKVYARSSLPVKFWLIVANSVWLIDSDYRWEIKVELTSLNWEVKLEDWTRIAQLEICPYFQEWKAFPTETPKIEMIVDSDIYEKFAENFPSDRGVGGFGSTAH